MANGHILIACRRWPAGSLCWLAHFNSSTHRRVNTENTIFMKLLLKLSTYAAYLAK